MTGLILSLSLCPFSLYLSLSLLILLSLALSLGLSPQCFGDRYKIFPVVRAILALFILEHNWVAARLAELNRDNVIFSSEEEHFQKARAVVLGLFINVILYDFVGAVSSPGVS